MGKSCSREQVCSLSVEDVEMEVISVLVITKKAKRCWVFFTLQFLSGR